jgi:hypothetical protein
LLADGAHSAEQRRRCRETHGLQTRRRPQRQ